LHEELRACLPQPEYGFHPDLSLIQALGAQQSADSHPNKLADIQTALAGNQERLHSYQWIETTTATIKGSTRPPRRVLCHYMPSGEVQRVQLDSEQPSAEAEAGGRGGRGGLIRGMIVKKKKEEMKEEVAAIRDAVSPYVHLDKEKLRSAIQDGRFSFDQDGGTTSITLRDFAKPGDSVNLRLNREKKELNSVAVNTFLEKKHDKISLTVQFAMLPDGTRYPSLTNIALPSKQITIDESRSDYTKLAN
jgi:hypothetical protein